MRHIYRDHVNTDMDYDSFIEISRKCWEDKFGFLLISKDDDIKNGRYRKGFHQFILL